MEINRSRSTFVIGMDILFVTHLSMYIRLQVYKVEDI